MTVVGAGSSDAGDTSPGDIVGSEFAEVEVTFDRSGNGIRLRLEDLRTGRVRFLDALELVHYSRIPDLLTSGPARADVVFVQVSAADETGRHSMSLTDDYLSAVIDSAAVVIVEINDRAPVVAGARTLGPGEWTAAVRSSREPAQMESAHASDVVHAVARNVASLIEDGATLQFGIGAVPEAVLRELVSTVAFSTKPPWN
jgi:acyl-CoA hydrolase